MPTDTHTSESPRTLPTEQLQLVSICLDALDRYCASGCVASHTELDAFALLLSYCSSLTDTSALSELSLLQRQILNQMAALLCLMLFERVVLSGEEETALLREVDITVAEESRWITRAGGRLLALELFFWAIGSEPNNISAALWEELSSTLSQAEEESFQHKSALPVLKDLTERLKKCEGVLPARILITRECLGRLLESHCRASYNMASIRLQGVAYTCTGQTDVLRSFRHVLPVVFSLLVQASDVGMAASRLCGSHRALEFMQTHVRPALLGDSRHSASSTCLTVHSSLALSHNPYRVVDGIGVVAMAPIEEGTLLVCEAPIFFWQRGDYEFVQHAEAIHGGRCWQNVGASPMSLAQQKAHELVERIELSPKEVLLLNSDGGCLFGGSLQTPSHMTRLGRLLSQMPLTTDFNGDIGRDVTMFLSAAAHNSTPITGVDVFKMGMPCWDDIMGSDYWSSLCSSEAGKGLYYFSRHFNHSCSPNAMLYFPTTITKPRPTEERQGTSRMSSSNTPQEIFTGEVCVIALRSIAPGEEITISYGPSLSVSRAEKCALYGFCCRCSFCEDKTALLEGICCHQCGQLVYEPPSWVTAASPVRHHILSGVAPQLRQAKPYQHAEGCSLCDSDFQEIQRNHCDRIAAAIDAAEEPVMHPQGRNKEGCTANVQHGEEACEATIGAVCPYTVAVRQLLDLDRCTNMCVLPTHYLRLRLRQELFSISILATALTTQDSAQILQLSADGLEDLELLLSPNDPFLTGMRMYYVFARSRHCVATTEAEDLQGRRAPAADCCGAVREEAAMLRRPFFLDRVLRTCIVRSFQEHFVQCVGWSVAEGQMESTAVLHSFLRRFPLELMAAGVDSVECFHMVTMMEEEAEASAATRPV